MRLLYTGNDFRDARVARRQQQSVGRADSSRARRQPVSLHWLSEHRALGAGRRGGGRTMMATTVAAPARVFGSGIKRREDPRLLTGTAKYTADISLPGQLYAAILRSPHGHARLGKIDTAAAKAAPGVVAAFTGADTEGVLGT